LCSALLSTQTYAIIVKSIELTLSNTFHAESPELGGWGEGRGILIDPTCQYVDNIK